MTPTEPTAALADLLRDLDKWSSVYPTWGDSGAEQRCRMAAAQIRADAATIQSLAERVRVLEAAFDEACKRLCIYCSGGDEVCLDRSGKWVHPETDEVFEEPCEAHWLRAALRMEEK